jgi:Ca-activated chloride channel family protein
MRPLACVGYCVGLWSALASGAPQQQADQRPTISIETNLVMLPVTVVDRHGAFVAGLTRESFTVYDNGTPQPIEFFTGEDIPATVGLVIDSSSSMRGQREAVTAAAIAFAASSHPLDEVFTVNFNELVWTGLPRGVTFAENIDQLRAALAAAPAQGMTAVYDAVDRALDQLQLGTRDRKVLIVVSDGGDNASRQTLAGVVDRARRADARIYSVILTDPDDHDARPDVLKKVARETGGETYTPKRVEDVRTAFARIAREVRSGYTIGFSPPDALDGRFRTVRVVADAGDGRQLSVRTRTGYHLGRSGRGVK